MRMLRVTCFAYKLETEPRMLIDFEFSVPTKLQYEIIL